MPFHRSPHRAAALTLAAGVALAAAPVVWAQPVTAVVHANGHVIAAGLRQPAVLSSAEAAEAVEKLGESLREKGC